MKTNWLKKVNEINRRKYVVPSGWETREEVALNLACDPGKVDELLKPGLQAGDFESESFLVWDEGRRMAIRTKCYREVPTKGADAPQASVTTRVSSPRGASMDDRIRAALARFPDAPDREISRKVFKASCVDVARVRLGG